TDHPLELHAFDLLAARGIDLRGVALLDRKAQLERVVGRTGAVRYVDHVVGRGPEVFDHACRLGAEGIVSKRADGTYRSGRHRGWTKSKCRGREDFVIGGYVTRGTGLSSLLLGERDADGLRYVGRVGTGFTEADRRSVRARLEPLRRPDPPFTVAPPVPRRDTVTWVEPSASVEIAFAERTRDGMVRHASFLGLRDDRASPPSRAQAAAQTPVPPVSNADKVLYPEVGLTKGELAAWIHRMAPWILPHVANRPLSLVRCPNGHDRPCFFQKHHLPGSAAIHPVDVPGSDQRYLAIDDAAGLVALVQLGALEIHPWGSTVDHLEHPDRLVIDLDPDESLGFDAVVAAALDVRERLDAIGLQTYPRWTGGKGVHVVAPLTPTAPWATVKELSRRLAHAMVRDAPSAYVAVATKARRRGKVFVDWLRNGRGATAIASWSFRARPGAPVAVPLTWDALTPDLDRSRFTVRDLEPPEVDPWSGFDALEQAVDDRMVARLGPS
ncbi:MAG: DNA ligase D, partial [Myxococcota bacterium]